MPGSMATTPLIAFRPFQVVLIVPLAAAFVSGRRLAMNSW